MLVAIEAEYGTTCKLGGSAGRIEGQLEVRMRGRQRSGFFHLGDLLRMALTLKDRSMLSMLPDEFRTEKVLVALNHGVGMLSERMQNDTLIAELSFTTDTGTCKIEMRASIVLNNLLNAIPSSKEQA